MAEMKDFIDALLEGETEEKYENNNDDLDLGAVFDLCCSDTQPHTVRFADGSTGQFTF